MSHGHRYRPQLWLVHGPRHVPWQQSRLGCHHDPSWQCRSLRLHGPNGSVAPRPLHGPRCEPRFQTSARTWMATGALDISVGPDFSGAHPMPRSWVAAHLTQVCMGPGVAQSSGTKRTMWRHRFWALVWPLVVTQATDISSDSGYGRTTWSSAAARAWR